MDDLRNCQTQGATPAEPGDLLKALAHHSPMISNIRAQRQLPPRSARGFVASTPSVHRRNFLVPSLLGKALYGRRAQRAPKRAPRTGKHPVREIPSLLARSGPVNRPVQLVNACLGLLGKADQFDRAGGQRRRRAGDVLAFHTGPEQHLLEL